MQQPDLDPYLVEDVTFPKSLGEFLLEYCQSRLLYTVTHPDPKLKLLQDLAPMYKWKINYEIGDGFLDLMLALRRAMWHRNRDGWKTNFWWLRGNQTRDRQKMDAAERFAVTVRNGRRRAGVRPDGL